MRLSDVAQVELVAPELTIGRHMDGRPAVGIDVYKSTQANVVDVADRVIAAVDEARDAPQLQGIEILVVGNQADSIRQSLRELRNAGLIGAGLSFFMLLLFLRHLPTTLIVSLAVPASLLVTLGAMYFLGFTLNILTMMGMLLAIGMLVDNSVVITESIFRHRQLNAGPARRGDRRGRPGGRHRHAGRHLLDDHRVPAAGVRREEPDVDLPGARRRADRRRDARLAGRRADADPDARGAHVPPPPVSGDLAVRPPAATATPRRSTGRWTTRRRWRWSPLLLLVSPVPLFALKLAKVDPFPQEASRTLCLAYHLNGSYPMERVEQAVKRIEAYIEANKERFDVDTYYSVVGGRRGLHAPLPQAQGRGDRAGRAEVMRRISEGLPEIIIGKPSFQFDQGAAAVRRRSRCSSPGESTERLADDLARRGAAPVERAGPRSRALRGRHRRGGSAGRSSTATAPRSSG